MVWMLGEDLPRAYGSGIASQVFAVLTVATGLVSFALVLALVEQASGWCVFCLTAQFVVLLRTLRCAPQEQGSRVGRSGNSRVGCPLH